MSNNLEGKKLLILGGAFQHIKVVEAAKRLGLITYVTDYIENSPAKKIADVALNFNVKDVDKIVEYCKKEKIDGVISTSLDPCQIPYQQICEKLNLYCFGAKEQFYKLTNKVAFKECCTEYGVDTIPSYTIEDFRDNKIVEYPIFIKPVDSRGSRGQTVCYKKEEVEDAINFAKKESSTGEIVIEKYMKGYQDFTVSYIFIDGEGYLVRTADRYLGSEKEGLNKVCIASKCPSGHTDMYLKNVNEKVINMFKGIGIKNGPVFMQGFVDGDTVRFYDPGLRFSGGDYERTFKLATGIDLIEMLVRFSIEGKISKGLIEKDIVYLKGKRVFQICPTVHSGKIKKIEGEEKIKNYKEIISFSKRYNINDIIPNKNDVSRRFASIAILCQNKNMELEILQCIQKELHVLDEENNDLICDKLDINNL